MKNKLTKDQVISLIEGVNGMHELETFIINLKYDSRQFFLNGPFEELLLSGQDILFSILDDGQGAEWDDYVDILESVNESAKEKFDRYYASRIKDDGYFHLSKADLVSLRSQAAAARTFLLFLERITGKKGNPFAPEDPLSKIFNCITVEEELL